MRYSLDTRPRLAWVVYTNMPYVCFVIHCHSAVLPYIGVTCYTPLFSCEIITVIMVHPHVPKLTAFSLCCLKSFAGTLAGLSVTTSGQRLLGFKLDYTIAQYTCSFCHVATLRNNGRLLLLMSHMLLL